MWMRWKNFSRSLFFRCDNNQNNDDDKSSLYWCVWNAQNTLLFRFIFFLSLTAKLMLVCSLNSSARIYYFLSVSLSFPFSFANIRWWTQTQFHSAHIHTHTQRYTNIVYIYLCFQLQSSVNTCECANMPMVHMSNTHQHMLCTYAKWMESLISTVSVTS